MSKIYVTADTHGDIDLWKLTSHHFPEGKKLNKNDIVIICGDSGIIWYGNNKDNYLINWYNNKPWTTLFVDGNHCNFNALYKYPIVDKFGGKVHKISDSIFHLCRGGYYTIEGKTFFTFGGARSHDLWCRKEGKSWWKEELPTGEECEYGFEVLTAHGNKADFLITHCADDILLHEIERVNHFHAEHDILTNYLRIIKSIADFGHHYFGHYHYDADFDGKATVLYNKIIQII